TAGYNSPFIRGGLLKRSPDRDVRRLIRGRASHSCRRPSHDIHVSAETSVYHSRVRVRYRRRHGNDGRHKDDVDIRRHNLIVLFRRWFSIFQLRSMSAALFSFFPPALIVRFPLASIRSLAPAVSNTILLPSLSAIVTLLLASVSSKTIVCPVRDLMMR